MKERLRDKKNIGKRRQPSSPDVENKIQDGFAPPKKKLVKKVEQLDDDQD